MAVITGTAGNDDDVTNPALTGTLDDDIIGGLAGNDVIRGLSGDDVLRGGPGRDNVSGGGGNDVLVYAENDDNLLGGLAGETIGGGDGFDTIRLVGSPSQMIFTGDIDEIERITFERVITGTSTIVITESSDFGGFGFAATLELVGKANTEQKFAVGPPTGGATVVDASQWKFTNWDNDEDSIFFLPSFSGPDSIIGSSQDDDVGYFEFLDRTGKASVSEGSIINTLGGNDRIFIGGSHNTTRINGGGGSDTLGILFPGDGGDTTSLGPAVIRSIEILDLSEGASLTLLASHVGGLKISSAASIQGDADAAQDIQFLMFTATALNLSGWKFSSWNAGSAVEIRGDGSVETIVGSTRGDEIFASGGTDSLAGFAGNDTLDGGSGNDTLSGDGGVDELIGGLGADRFQFRRIADSGTAADRRDVITDFDASDIIDVSAIDANVTVRGNQAFKIDVNGIGVRGEIQLVKAGDSTLVRFFTDADAAPEMIVVVRGPVAPVAADFVL